jgi:hypothetical protein
MLPRRFSLPGSLKVWLWPYGRWFSEMQRAGDDAASGKALAARQPKGTAIHLILDAWLTLHEWLITTLLAYQLICKAARQRRTGCGMQKRRSCCVTSWTTRQKQQRWRATARRGVGVFIIQGWWVLWSGEMTPASDGSTQQMHISIDPVRTSVSSLLIVGRTPTTAGCSRPSRLNLNCLSASFRLLFAGCRHTHTHNHVLLLLLCVLLPAEGIHTHTGLFIEAASRECLEARTVPVAGISWPLQVCSHRLMRSCRQRVTSRLWRLAKNALRWSSQALTGEGSCFHKGIPLASTPVIGTGQRLRHQRASL